MKSLIERTREKAAEIRAQGRIEIEATKAAGAPAHYVQRGTGYLVREMPNSSIEIVDKRGYR